MDLPGYGRAVLNRVRNTDTGLDHAEIRIRIALRPAEPAARRQLVGILSDLRHLVTRAAIAHRPDPARRRAAR